MKKIIALFGTLALFLPRIAMGDEMIEIGKKAPAFELKDADMKAFTSLEQLKEGPLVLVFYRSGDW